MSTMQPHPDEGEGERSGNTSKSSVTIRVFLIERHTIVREGLRALLDRELDIDVIGEAASVSEAVGTDVQTDVVLTDLELPDARGDSVVAALRHRFGDASVFVLSRLDHPALVKQVLAAGANGYLSKTCTAGELLVGIRAVARGETFLQSSLGVQLARWSADGPGVVPFVGGPLSLKEVEVLAMVAVGHTNSEVAALLGMQLRTVEAHRERILQKLHQPTRAQLFQYAQQLGLIGYNTSS